MGAKSSKQVQQGDRESNTLVQNPNSFVEKSSGFHMVEIHLPSVGISTFMFIVLLIVFVVLFMTYRRWVRKQEQRRILQAYYRRGQGQEDMVGLGLQAMQRRVLQPPSFAPPLPPLPRRNHQQGRRPYHDSPPRYSRTQENPRSSGNCSDEDRLR